MKKIIFLGIMVLLLSLASSAPAQITPQVCTTPSPGELSPSFATYEVGQTIEYEIDVTVNPGRCDINDLEIYFYPPGTLPSGGACSGTNPVGGGTLIDQDIDLLSGGPGVDYNSVDNTVLAYMVTEEDVDCGGSIIAYAAIRFIPREGELLGLAVCQELSSINFTEAPVPCIEVTKDVNCGLSKELDEVTYTYCVENCGDSNIVEITTLTDTLPGIDEGALKAALNAEILAQPDSNLASGEQVCVDVDYEIPEGAEDPLINTVSITATDECGTETDPASTDTATVDLVHPNFTVTKDCRTDPLEPDETAIFDITVENTGDVCLRIEANDLGDVQDPCIFNLAPLDSKTWETYQAGAEGDVFNKVKVVATLRPGDPLTTCGDPCDCLTNKITKYAEDTCPLGGGATRTWGFWKTHYYQSKYIFDDCFGVEDPCLDLGWTGVNDVNVMMAIFWEKKAGYNSLCKARLQLARQYMAAVLNDCHPEGLDFESFTGLTKEEVVEMSESCDAKAIQDMAGDIGDYNEEGDDEEMQFPMGLKAYNAVPKFARQQAEGEFPDGCEDCDGATVITPVKVKGPKGVSTQGGGKGKGKK